MEESKISKDFNSKNAIIALKEFETQEEIAAFIAEGEDRKTVLAAAEACVAKLIEAESEEAAPAPKPKEITSAELIKEYWALYHKFTAFESQQKKAKKAFRHVVVARRRMEVQCNNFIRNSR